MLFFRHRRHAITTTFIFKLSLPQLLKIDPIYQANIVSLIQGLETSNLNSSLLFGLRLVSQKIKGLFSLLTNSPSFEVSIKFLSLYKYDTCKGTVYIIYHGIITSNKRN